MSGRHGRETATDGVRGAGVEGLCRVLEVCPGVEVDHRSPAPATSTHTICHADRVTPDNSGWIKTGAYAVLSSPSSPPQWRKSTSPSVRSRPPVFLFSLTLFLPPALPFVANFAAGAIAGISEILTFYPLGALPTCRLVPLLESCPP